MGAKKKYLEKRTVLQFKLTKENRKKFHKIISDKLDTTACAVLNNFVVDFIEKWKTEEGKLEIYTKYFKK